MSFERYGIEWPDGTSLGTVELSCYRRGGSVAGGRAYHMKRAIKELWPEPVYVWSSWSDRLVEAWCDWDWLTIWGASSTGKSTTMGLCALVHWLSAPWCTTMTVCSTTKDALRKRIWSEVLKFYTYLPDAPGRYYPGRTAIIFPQVADPSMLVSGEIDLSEDSELIKESRSGIFGVAVQRGSMHESFSNMIGVHNVYNALLLDEMQAVREAAVEAVSNLQGGKEFKFIGMGNPSSRLDLLGRYSRPKSGNWKDISPDLDGWETEMGYCVFLDGRKSPAVVEEGGEERYPFFLKRSDIELRKKWFGENSFKFWSQTIGFIPPDDAERTVFTETFLIYNEMDRGVVWDSGYDLVAGVDWAFTVGGDRCVLKPARVGEVNGVMVLEFLPEVEIPIDVSDVEPSSFLVAKRVMRECMSLGIEPGNVGCDVSGTQGPQTDILEQVWGVGVLRVNFGGRVEDRVIGDGVHSARDIYSNRVTQLWYQLYELGKSRQVKGVDGALSVELISRRLVDKSGRDDGKLQLETKSVMKSRSGYSPDIADAAVIAVEVAVQRLGLGVHGMNVGGVVGDHLGFARMVNDDERELFMVSAEEGYV